MAQLEQEIFERLGNDGMLRVLDDLLDRNRLVKLANACGLEYPGMRTRSQTRKTILGDLVQKSEKESSTRRAIVRTLRKDTAPAFRSWKRLKAEEKAARLGDPAFLRRRGNLGLHLFFLALTEKEEEGFESLLARQQLLRLARNGGGGESSAPKPAREELQLQKKIAQLEKKLQHQEGQLLKVRETEKTLKRDLVQRKGELAESRMLAERIGRELAEARATVEATTTKEKPVETGGSMDQLGRSLRKLATEQRKLAHHIEKLKVPSAPKPRPAAKDLAPLTEALGRIEEQFAEFGRKTGKQYSTQTKQLEELRVEIAAVKKTQATAPVVRRKTKKPRPKGAAQRVGVFIDVQNMFYGARRLKGKLDFDALLEAAVRGRRLVQPTAYVVESKEIDQSGFIGILQQRAIEVRRKNLRVRADGSTKGDWDMELALDILDAAPRLDVVVLVSGDGDFTSLVKRVKQMGPRVEVIGFPRTTAKSLIQAADEYHPLNRKFMIYPTRTAKPTKPRKNAPTDSGGAADPAAEETAESAQAKVAAN